MLEGSPRLKDIDNNFHEFITTGAWGGTAGSANILKDMTKFGGSENGKSKQACVERKCSNMGVKGEEESGSETDEPVVEKSPVKTPVKHKVQQVN